MDLMRRLIQIRVNSLTSTYSTWLMAYIPPEKHQLFFLIFEVLFVKKGPAIDEVGSHFEGSVGVQTENSPVLK